VNHDYWYATRGTGAAALILLTLVVAAGVAGSLRLRGERWPRFLVVGLHRNLTLLTLVFLGVHVGTTVLDSYTPIALRDAVLPFAARYRPVWVALGAVALDLLLALTVTSFVRARIGHRRWRALHWLAYAAWPVALAHGLGTGSDARFAWMQALAVACVLAVLGAVVVRVARAAAPRGHRGLTLGAALMVAVAGGVWYRSGPAAHGWAARAGTPKTLLAKRVTRAAPDRPTPAARRIVDVPRLPFTTHLAARLSTAREPGGLVRVDIRGRTSGGGEGVLWIRLTGEPTVDGGVQLTASGVRYGTRSDPNLYVGSVRELSGRQMVIALHNAAGRRLDLDVALQIDETTAAVTGVVRAVRPEGSQ